MEILDQSEKALYEKCKYEVKVWEHKFKKTNGRLPSRLDIKEADSNVRNAYKTYFRLKTAALEKSFMGIDGFHSDEEQYKCETPQALSMNKNEVLGDIKKTNLPDSTWGSHLNKKPLEKFHSEPSKPSANLNQKFVNKLSVGSKLVKRNPRKSLSQSKMNCNNTKDKAAVGVSGTPICRAYSEPVESQMNLEDLNSELEHSHITEQKIKIVSSDKIIPKPINIIDDLMDKKLGINQKLRNVDIKWLERVETTTEFINKTGTQLTKVDHISDDDIIDNSDEDSNCSSHVAKRFKFNNSITPNFKILPKPNTISDNSMSENIPTHSFKVHDNCPDTETTKPSNISIVSSIENSIHKNFHNEKKLEDSVIMQPQQSESSLQNTVFSKNDPIDDKNEMNKGGDDLRSNLKKKNSNENFVRINMKKKIYARGRKTINFSNYKKKLWKSRKKFAEQMEEGNDTSKKKFGKLMPLEVYHSGEEDNILTTLDEASGTVVPQLHSETRTSVIQNNGDDEDDLPLSEIKKSLSAHTQDKCRSIPRQSQTETRKKLPETRITKVKSTKCVNKTKCKKVNENKSNHMEEYDDDIEIEKENRDLGNSMQQSMYDDDDFNLLLETIRVENMLDMKGVYPLYSTKDDGTLIDTPPEVYNALRLFGHESFRGGQERAVMRILSGKSTLVTSSTGSGKSLCYQLPAYLFRQKYRCISLVISPLISLMEDQIKCMPGVLNAVCLHGNQTKSQRDMIIKSLTNGDVSILMVSPESILSCDYSTGFGSILSRIPPIAFACLDEAHCLSQWSHNFRPSYLVVCQILKEKLGIQTILGLTATATESTRNSLITQLQISDGESGVIRDTPIPSNLMLTVSRDTNREQALLELLLSKPFVDFTSIIIYCLRRNECEKVASFLRASLKDYIPTSNSKKRKRISSQVEAYHAGLSGAKRKTIQNAFTSGDLRIVVATVAFGMGINKSDIRSVIHYNMPANFESYVQEIGRAGRDGLPAHCHIFLDRQHADVYELRRHIYGNSVDRHIIRKLLRKVFIPCNCEGNCMKHEIMFSVNSTVNALDIPEEVISTLLCYLELHEKKYIKVLKQSYGKCKIQSYGGNTLIHKTALSCEPLKCALKMNENDKEPSNLLEFSILKVSKQLNYDTGICKQILKNLEWTNINGQPKRTALNVEFFDLSFHLLSPGNLPDEDLDEVLDTLYKKVLNQENVAYAQLVDIDQTLSKVALPTCKNLGETEEKSESLKKDIREYFESNKTITPVELPEISEEDKNAIIRDIRLIVDRYGDENFTGRSIARIFHGIASPNFQPRIWGRTKFWRGHLKVHFNTICKIATSELIKIHS